MTGPARPAPPEPVTPSPRAPPAPPSLQTAPLASPLIGATLDTLLFFTIAFSAALTWIEPANDVSWANEALPLLGTGPVAPLWMSLAVADWGVKLALALLALIPFRLILRRLSAKGAIA